MTLLSLFGTDGMRGRANVWPMTPQATVNIALATAQHIRKSENIHRVLIGKDTRLSGYMLETALTSGFLSMGMDVLLLGPLPTPAVAILTHAMRADLGVMISASHNPHHDNGMKFFKPNSLKLTSADQNTIEELAAQSLFTQVDATALGRARRLNDAGGRYIEVAKRSLGNRMRFESLKIVLDCAHGAAYKVAPLILWELGTEVVPLGVSPDGTNINHNCGAMHPQILQEAVKTHKADAGIALDGDGDRVAVVDENGKLADSEQVLAMIATDMQERGLLDPAVVVTTKMTSCGFQKYCRSRNIDVHITEVGDRYVSEQMQKSGARIGGESSGHIILADYSHCSDGTISALQILRIMKEKRLPLSQLINLFTPTPMLHHTVPWTQNYDPAARAPLKSNLSQINQELGDNGRVFVRKSGTEPIMRIMIECEDESVMPDILKRVITLLNSAEEENLQPKNTDTSAPPYSSRLTSARD